MTALKIFFSLVMCGVIIAGCASVSSTNSKSNVVPNHLPFLLSVVQHKSKLECTILASSKTHRFEEIGYEYHHSGDSYLEIDDSTGAPLYKGEMILHRSWNELDTPGTVIAKIISPFVWDVPDSVTHSFHGTAHFRAYFDTKDQILDTTLPVFFDYTKTDPLRFSLGIDQMTNGFQLNMTVIRLRKVLNEYLPTSLNHDWVVLDDEGRTMWQESFGQNYAQVLGTVEPQTPGRSAVHVDSWDGFGNVNPGKLSPGHYRLVGIIPCKPVAVSDTVEFRIK